MQTRTARFCRHIQINIFIALIACCDALWTNTWCTPCAFCIQSISMAKVNFIVHLALLVLSFVHGASVEGIQHPHYKWFVSQGGDVATCQQQHQCCELCIQTLVHCTVPCCIHLLNVINAVEMNKLLPLSYRNTKALIVSQMMKLYWDDTKSFSNMIFIPKTSDTLFVGVHFTRNWYYIFFCSKRKSSKFSQFLFEHVSAHNQICFISIIQLTFVISKLFRISNRQTKIEDALSQSIWYWNCIILRNLVIEFM